MLLTTRQEQILKLKVHKHTNIEIAELLGCARTTIESTVKVIFAKLGLQLKPQDDRDARAVLVEEAYREYIKNKKPQ